MQSANSANMHISTLFCKYDNSCFFLPIPSSSLLSFPPFPSSSLLSSPPLRSSSHLLSSPLPSSPLLGLPVLDVDGMGRAFPELQMYLPFMLGSRPYPACVADNKGEVVAITHSDSAKALEDVLRAEVVKMG